MNNKTYIVATIKPWNIQAFNKTIKYYPGVWHLIDDHKELTVEKINAIDPEYIFFPHWNHIVPDEILKIATCVCFHETDLPYGRGGSPIQNLIATGHKQTMITAFKMTKELDAGPVYFQKPLSLDGLAEEIFIRASTIVADMIKTIVIQNPTPVEQVGKPTFFDRRKPEQSRISKDQKSLTDLFDHIRMLDADGYPKAFFEKDGFRYEISRPSLKAGKIIADVCITKLSGDQDD